MKINLDTKIKTLTGRKYAKGGTIRSFLIFAVENHPAKSPKLAADQLKVGRVLLGLPPVSDFDDAQLINLVACLPAIGETIPAGFLYMVLTGQICTVPAASFPTTTTTTTGA